MGISILARAQAMQDLRVYCKLKAVQQGDLCTVTTLAATGNYHQHVHRPMLALVAGCDQDNEGWSDEVLMPIADGRTKRYCDWWHEQAVEQDNHILFSVRLIGDASCPQLYTLVAHNDLAYCRYAVAHLCGCCFKVVPTPATGLHKRHRVRFVFTASGVTTQFWNIKQPEHPAV